MTPEIFITEPISYCGFSYRIYGVIGKGYRFTVCTLSGRKLITSELFDTIVATNQEARKRIATAARALEVISCQ